MGIDADGAESMVPTYGGEDPRGSFLPEAAACRRRPRIRRDAGRNRFPEADGHGRLAQAERLGKGS